ncbi:MAG: hypothetical protein ACK553_01415, partial [Planctomycetota bacterium]
VAAGICSLPEHSPHTSIKERVEHLIAQGRLQDIAQIRTGSVAAQRVSEGIEQSHWLIPIEDQRTLGSIREGIKEGFTLGQYLMLVDCMSRTVNDFSYRAAAVAAKALAETRRRIEKSSSFPMHPK